MDTDIDKILKKLKPYFNKPFNTLIGNNRKIIDKKLDSILLSVFKDNRGSQFKYWYYNYKKPNFYKSISCGNCGKLCSWVNGKYNKHCCRKCASSSEEFKTKYKETWYSNYEKNISLCKDTWFGTTKNKTSMKKLYKVDNIMKVSKVKKKRNNYFLQKYGVDNITKSKYFKDLWKNKKFVDNVITKSISTKRENNSFNTSKLEEECYKLLCKSFGKRGVKRQYRSKEYPFNCDFYIPKFDTYIEYNGSWTHGPEPYNKRKKLHKEILKEWINKSKKSKYYKIAIDVWTCNDVEKRKIAKKNNINLVEFWNIEKLKEYLSKFKEASAKRVSRGVL
jgi:hypothetical protein